MTGYRMKNIIKFIALTALIVLVAACKPATVELETNTVSNKIERYIDIEADVVCWIYDGHQGDSISCLPIEQTKLDK
jgi:hypothetical protein